MRLRQKLILISFESRSSLQNAVKRISLHVFNYSPFFEKNSHHSVSLGGPLGIVPKALANLCVFLIEFLFNVQTVIVTYGLFFFLIKLKRFLKNGWTQLQQQWMKTQENEGPGWGQTILDKLYLYGHLVAHNQNTSSNPKFKSKIYP